MEYTQPCPAAPGSSAPAMAPYLADQRQTAEPAPRALSRAAEERLDADRLRRAVPSAAGEERRYAAMKEVLRPNLGMVYRLPTVDGYDGGLLPLRSFASFKALLVPDEQPVPHYTLAPQAPAQP